MRIERNGPALVFRYSEVEKKQDPNYKIKLLEHKVQKLEKRIALLEKLLEVTNGQV